MHESRTESSAFSTSPASFWAAAVPLLCALHCMAAPLVVVALPALALSKQAEYVLMLLSGGLAVGLVGRAVKLHGRRRVWLPVIGGLLVWTLGHLFWSHSPAERVLDVAGGFLLAGGLVWSAWLRHRALCRECGCPAHEQEQGCCDSTGCEAQSGTA